MASFLAEGDPDGRRSVTLHKRNQASTDLPIYKRGAPLMGRLLISALSRIVTTDFRGVCMETTFDYLRAHAVELGSRIL